MEIELKIPLSKDVFESLLVEVKDARKYTHFYKQDKYYSKFETKEERISNNEPLIRIRDLGDGKIKLFTLKRKFVQNGIEVNDEKETEIIDVSPIEELLSICSHKVWFSKLKESYCWQQIFNDITLNCELVCVNDKFYYFEVEAADYNGDKDVAIETLKECIQEYKLNYEDRDERTWIEILK